MPRRARCAIVVILASTATSAMLAGCSTDDIPGVGGGGGDETTEVPDPAVVADSNLPDPAENASNGQNVPEEPGFVQVDANTATVAELVATFETNGVADGEDWADQVIDHRPYATGDESGRAFDGLRDSLAATGLDEFGVEAIVASLTA